MFTLQKYFLCVKFSHEKRLCPKMAKSKFKITQFITYSNYLLKVFHTETTHSVFQTITKAAQTSEIGHKFLSVLQTTLRKYRSQLPYLHKNCHCVVVYMKNKLENFQPLSVSQVFQCWKGWLPGLTGLSGLTGIIGMYGLKGLTRLTRQPELSGVTNAEKAV